MELIIKSKLKRSLHAIYRITYNNGYVYVGSCSSTKFKGRIVGVNYFGSSSVALKYGWRKANISENNDFNRSQIRYFEVWYIKDENWRYDLESKFIHREATRLGIADCADIISPRKEWTSQYSKGGLLLNLQSGTMVHALGAAREKLLNSGPTSAQREHYNSMVQYQPKCMTKEAREKAVRTRKENNPDWAREFIRKGQLACHTPEALAKRSQTIKARRPKYVLSDGFVGDYLDIAEHLGVHRVIVRGWLKGTKALPKRVGFWSFKRI